MGAADTRDHILTSAKTEFLSYGFAGASLRRISSGAGVTTGALYKHFKDKAGLFDALVAPCVQEFMAKYNQAARQFMQDIDEHGMKWPSSEQNLVDWVLFIYDRLDTFKLLLMGAEKTVYEDFVHRMVNLEVRTTMEYLALARTKGFVIREISREEIHMLVNAQYSVLFEMVLHDIPKDKAVCYAKSMNRFFTAGWRAFFLN